MVTFLISGLWHGANWNFVLWGGAHGLVQILENAGERIIPCKKRGGKIQCLIKMIAVFLFCNFAWVLFRAESIEQAIYIYFNMFVGIENPFSFIIQGFKDLPFVRIILWKIILILIILFLFEFFDRKNDVIDLLEKQKKCVRWMVYCLFLFLMIIFLPVESGREFLYFKF